MHPKGHHLRMSELLHAEARVRAGASVSAAARELGRAASTLTPHLRRRGVSVPPRPGAGGPGPAALAASVARLAGAGLHAAAIARELSVSGRTVCRCAARQGVALADGRRAGRRPSPEQIEGMRDSALRQAQRAAASLGWPQLYRPTVARVLNLLLANGPSTHTELVAALGWPVYPRRAGPPRSTRLAGALRELVLLGYATKSSKAGGQAPRYAASPFASHLHDQKTGRVADDV